jgi:hypothetical protein
MFHNCEERERYEMSHHDGEADEADITAASINW